ncbi:MAG: hypothetical protein ACKVKF_24380 [Rhodobacterales bacterium]|uniref:hypothetical protein n=1 Tax=Puniceibacterium antarcticum TaxID=1206336 RepID=UPI00117ACF10|nr:hypothetical protein [Puniceibacterium antarcticum]
MNIRPALWHGAYQLKQEPETRWFEARSPISLERIAATFRREPASEDLSFTASSLRRSDGQPVSAHKTPPSVPK